MTAIIFDLGNVLMHFDHRIAVRRFTAEAAARGLATPRTTGVSDLVTAFELGTLDIRVFMDAFLERIGLAGSLDAARFAAIWNDIFWPNDRLIELLPGLRSHHTLVMLSNTNALHADFLRERHPSVFAPFEHIILSHEVGYRKPDHRIFVDALGRAGAQPDDTLFFDDIRSYALAASRLGIHGYQYVSVQGVRDALARHGIRC